jgi:hypothetical protein
MGVMRVGDVVKDRGRLVRCALAGLLVAASLAGCEPTGGGDGTDQAALDQPAPRFALADTDGNEVSLEALFANGPVAIVFSGCT